MWFRVRPVWVVFYSILVPISHNLPYSSGIDLLCVCLSSLAVSPDLEIKILKTNVITPLEINANEPMLAEAKAETTAFSGATAKMTPEEREAAIPP